MLQPQHTTKQGPWYQNTNSINACFTIWCHENCFHLTNTEGYTENGRISHNKMDQKHDGQLVRETNLKDSKIHLTACMKHAVTHVLCKITIFFLNKKIYWMLRGWAEYYFGMEVGEVETQSLFGTREEQKWLNFVLTVWQWMEFISLHWHWHE